jgi:HEAT repeat protein
MYRVRHEAGEALGAIGLPDCLDALREHQQDPVQEVRQGKQSPTLAAHVVTTTVTGVLHSEHVCAR